MHLVVRRHIAASPERVFAAWTQPEHLRAWWGPAGVSCPEAEVDLRVGGRYRIANQMSNGAVVWIAGVFERVDEPARLVYSWAHEPITEASEPTEMVEGDDHNYEVVAPPAGATVPYLPEDAEKKAVGDTTYYVQNGTYYRPFASGGDTIYMVVDDPTKQS